jgi:hypothetical protein
VLAIYNDPFIGLFRAIENIYPEVKCRILVDPDIKAPFRLFGKRIWGICGYTFFPDDGSTPEIRVSAHIPYVRVVEIIAHEVAHVIAGTKAGHGDGWRKVFDAIREEYIRSVEEGKK